MVTQHYIQQRFKSSGFWRRFYRTSFFCHFATVSSAEASKHVPRFFFFILGMRNQDALNPRIGNKMDHQVPPTAECGEEDARNRYVSLLTKLFTIDGIDT